MSPEQTTPSTPHNYAYLILAGVLLISVALAAAVLFFWPQQISPTIEPRHEEEMLPDGSYPTVEGNTTIRSTESGPQPL